MKERPIAFYPSMVRAILNGSKTHTRRMTNIPQDAFDTDYCPSRQKFVFLMQGASKPKYRQCPYGTPGDQLWVKEPWAATDYFDDVRPSKITGNTAICYATDQKIIGRMPITLGRGVGKARPAMFMPRWVARIRLEVVSVRCERLHSITHEQAVAEGIEQVGTMGIMPLYRDYSGYIVKGYFDARSSFQTLWDSINGTKPIRRWADNPWVWDIEFRVVEVRT